MFYRIVRIATTEPHGNTYVLAHYWRSRAAFRRGEAPTQINGFPMGLASKTGEVMTFDDRGRAQTRGGTWVDVTNPTNITGIEVWRLRTITIDRRALIREVVEAYYKRAKAGDYPRDYSDPRIKRSKRDPNGVLAETLTMVGEGRLV